MTDTAIAIVTPPHGEKQSQRLVSDAARKRRLEEKFGPELVASKLWWHDLEQQAGLYFLLWPLRKQIERCARRYLKGHRSEPFWQSVRRLIEKRCGENLRYREQTAYFDRLSKRISEQLAESNSSEVPILSKRERQRVNALADLFADFTWSSELPDGKARELFKAMAEFGKPVKGLDPKSKNYIEIWQSGVTGYSKIAEKADPEAWKRADRDSREQLRQDVAKAIRYYKSFR